MVWDTFEQGRRSGSKCSAPRTAPGGVGCKARLAGQQDTHLLWQQQVALCGPPGMELPYKSQQPRTQKYERAW